MKTKIVSWDRFLKVEKNSTAALNLASVHDPDLVKEIKEINKKLEDWVKQLWREVDILKRQMVRLGAPEYRVLRKGKKAA